MDTTSLPPASPTTASQQHGLGYPRLYPAPACHAPYGCALTALAPYGCALTALAPYGCALTALAPYGCALTALAPLIPAVPASASPRPRATPL